MSFYGVTDVWTYVIGALGIVLLPGPNSLFVLSVATSRGTRAGYQGAFGIFFGDSILLLLTALGAAGLLRTYPSLFLIVKYAGAAYLAFVGLKLMVAALSKVWRAQLPGEEAPVAEANLLQPFRRALIISLLNPKAIVFLLSFFVQFIDPMYEAPAVPFAILSIIIMVFSALYLSALIFLGARLAQTFRVRQKLTATLSGAVGALFVWFGVKLASASLS